MQSQSAAMDRRMDRIEKILKILLKSQSNHQKQAEVEQLNETIVCNSSSSDDKKASVTAGEIKE